jgi:hypothetical protein
MKYSKSNSAKTKERDMRRKATENLASLIYWLFEANFASYL